MCMMEVDKYGSRATDPYITQDHMAVGGGGGAIPIKVVGGVKNIKSA
jgi:hypothetical protein